MTTYKYKTNKIINDADVGIQKVLIEAETEKTNMD